MRWAADDIRNYQAALEYLSRNRWMKDIITRLQGSKTHYSVVFSQGSTFKDEFDPSTKKISWDPHGSLMVGGCLSPALALGHELAHADGYNYSPVRFQLRSLILDNQYGTSEEKRVITGPESSAAATLGEPRRRTHDVNEPQDRVERNSTSRSCYPRNLQ